MNKRTIIVGDTHGSFPDFLRQKNLTAFHVGDFGAGFPGMYWKINTMNDILVQNNSHLYVNRGNHDNPDYWVNKPKFSNIHFVPSYETVNHNEETYLFLGGAISVDRSARVVGVSHWHDEGFDYSLDSLLAVKNLDKVTYVISHTAPTDCYPQGFGQICYDYGKQDKTLLDELTQERNNMQIICREIFGRCPKLKHWYYGHFHPRNNVASSLFTCLAIDDFVEIKKENP
jgi:hypothetical protein